MRLSILVPWRDDEGNRSAVKAWVLDRWALHYPDAEIVEAADDGGIPFSKAMAVNAAAARASGDVFAILDADTWVAPETVAAGLAAIRSGKARWVLPCRQAHRLTEQLTAKLLASDPGAPLPKISTLARQHVEVTTGAVGFLHLLPRAAFEAVNGMDPRFRGWGGEDSTFIGAVDTLWGPHLRLEGTALHLWHPRPRVAGKRVWPGQVERNSVLMRRYHACRGNPAAMRQLVREHA
jgi:hypothetical protein